MLSGSKQVASHYNNFQSMDSMFPPPLNPNNNFQSMDSSNIVIIQQHMGQRGQTMTGKTYLEDFHAGLVDGAHYSAAGLHCVLHRLHDNSCSTCIQTCSALCVRHACVVYMSHIVSHVIYCGICHILCSCHACIYCAFHVMRAYHECITYHHGLSDRG